MFGKVKGRKKLELFGNIKRGVNSNYLKDLVCG